MIGNSEIYASFFDNYFHLFGNLERMLIKCYRVEALAFILYVCFNMEIIHTNSQL